MAPSAVANDADGAALQAVNSRKRSAIKLGLRSDRITYSFDIIASFLGQVEASKGRTMSFKSSFPPVEVPTEPFSQQLLHVLLEHAAKDPARPAIV